MVSEGLNLAEGRGEECVCTEVIYGTIGRILGN